MSAFLGHIHYWLYRKIQLLVERENLILEKTTKVVDDLAEELHSISVDTYGEPINPSIPLENIIDHGNIMAGCPTKSTSHLFAKQLSSKICSILTLAMKPYM